MGIYKHPNSRFWYYTFNINGKRITGSTKTTSKTLANEIYFSKRVDYLRSQHGLFDKKSYPFTKLAATFLEWSEANKRSYIRDTQLVNHLRKFFGSRDIHDISGLDIEKYKLKRKG